jgi:alpha-tubulin suppressor-like RCC1 family protein
MMSGAVRCWGANDDGQLGDGTRTPHTIPPTTDVLTNVQAIAAGYNDTCALLGAGGIRCWGDNEWGQVGESNPARCTTLCLTPPTTDTLSGAKAIAASTATCALMTTGGIRCWGDNDLGQLGDGTDVQRNSPPSTDVLSGVQAIAMGQSHTCTLMTTGGVRCWGLNDSGQLGDGTVTTRRSPPAADVLTGVQAIAIGGLHTCALMATGGVRCWGDNRHGELGFQRKDFVPSAVPGLCE